MHLSAQSNSKLLISNDSLIRLNTSLVHKDSIANNILALQNFGSRFMLNPNRRDVAQSILNKYASYGLTELRLDSFLCYTPSGSFIPNDTFTWQYNVEAKIIGSEYPDTEIIIMGHYDSFVQFTNDLSFAPGADDNASGTSAALECARVLMQANYQPRSTVVFLATAAEELLGRGDYGSMHYAKQALANGRKIKMVINNDMVAHDSGSWTVRIHNFENSIHLTDLAVDIIENYTSLNYNRLSLSESFGADIEPFIMAGYSGVYFMEEDRNPNYHKVTDILDSCNLDYTAEVTKISIGMITKFDLNLATNETLPEFKDVRLFPNPANNFVNIDFTFQFAEAKFTVYNQIGQQVVDYSKIAKPGLIKVNTSNLNSGIYFIAIEVDNHKIYKKFVKI
jgi:hypothetical protein